MEGKRLAVIPKEIIEEIKERNNIEDVISSYVTLKRAGSNMNGLCPFHSEKTPSFTVFLGTRTFYCFGCGAGGDVITFIMRAENLDYRGALEHLAKRAGIDIPADDGQYSDVSRARNRTLEMNKTAAKFFHSVLLSPEGRPGYEYLHVKRGLSDATIKHFGLGYAPDSFGELTGRLKKAGYTDEEINAAFLGGISKKTGRVFDMFRGRVMFPVIDVNGNVIAFSGRVLEGNDRKYINSSDTPAFKKSKNLFALNFAKKYCAQQLILCEGNLDVVSCHAFGFQNAVATLGTAITPEQARLMKRYTKSVVISYDSDEAGKRAADKAFRVLSDVGLETKVLQMEGAKDPDEYLRKFGPERFRRLLEGGKSRFDFTFENELAKRDLSLADERIKAAKNMTAVISRISSSVEREVYVHRVAEKLGISFDSLRADVERERKKEDAAAKREQTQQIMRKTEGYGDRVNPDYLKNPRAAKAEESILGILLSFPEMIKDVKDVISPEDFFTSFGRSVYEKIISLDGDYDFGRLNESFSAEQMSRVTAMKIAREGLSNDKKVLDECISTLKKSKNIKNMDINDILKEKREKHD